MAKQTAVLRIYKGTKILMEADGKTPANENQDVTLTYNDTQWGNHLTNLKRLGVCKIEVREFYEGETKTEIPKELQDEIDSLLKVQVQELTPEQKTIKELTERLAKLEAKENQSNVNDLQVVGKENVSDSVSNAFGVVGAENNQIADNNEKSLLDAQTKYFKKFNKKVPNPFKNNLAWILTELEK